MTDAAQILAQQTLDLHMPAPQTAEVNGVIMTYYEAGAASRRAGRPPVILCHGWPELAFSWRNQLKAFEAAGIWAIAPDQRGYGATPGPEPVEAYDMVHLTADLVALLDHLGVEKAVWCGHDWGGIVIWQMALMHPDRTAGIIALNTPYMLRPPVDPIAIMRARMGDEMYIVHFQKPGEADAILNAHTHQLFDMLMRRPLEGEAPSAGLSSQREGEASVFPLVRMAEAYDPAFDPRATFLTAAEFAVFVETFKRTGFTGGINWYRNFTRNWENSSHLPVRIDNIPCLMVTAEKDAVLPPSAASHMPEFVGDLETVLIEGSGHWTQQEKPDEVNQVLLTWLAKRFPAG